MRQEELEKQLGDKRPKNWWEVSPREDASPAITLVACLAFIIIILQAAPDALAAAGPTAGFELTEAELSGIMLSVTQYMYRFLVIDGDKARRKRRVQTLEKMGYTYVQESDYTSFRRMLRTQLDLILLPAVEDAEQCLFQLANLDSKQAVPVVLIASASQGQQAALTKWIRRGAAAILFENEFEVSKKALAVSRFFDVAGVPKIHRSRPELGSIQCESGAARERTEQVRAHCLSAANSLFPPAPADSALAAATRMMNFANANDTKDFETEAPTVGQRVQRIWSSCNYTNAQRAQFLFAFSDPGKLVTFLEVVEFLEKIVFVVQRRYAVLRRFPSLANPDNTPVAMPKLSNEEVSVLSSLFKDVLGMPCPESVIRAGLADDFNVSKPTPKPLAASSASEASEAVLPSERPKRPDSALEKSIVSPQDLFLQGEAFDKLRSSLGKAATKHAQHIISQFEKDRNRFENQLEERSMQIVNQEDRSKETQAQVTEVVSLRTVITWCS